MEIADGDAYKTRKSKYGYKGIDVRASYAHLPFQLFWTWVTGKALPCGEPRKPKETLLKNYQFYTQIIWSWSIIIASVLFAGTYEGAILSEIAVGTVAIVLVTNRTRGLLHTFHYTIHGGSIPNMKLARFVGKYFLNIPIMHTPWTQYKKLHVADHHKLTLLCTNKDPDQRFMVDHGFKERMSEREFWTTLFTAPFRPSRILAHIWFRIETNFFKAEKHEVIPRVIFWVGLILGSYYLNFLDELALYYLFPLFIVTQFSSYLQHIIEHLWFPPPKGELPQKVYVGLMTWGRFLGRPFPKYSDYSLGKYMLKQVEWWLKLFLVDIPIRLFSFMQDLPSHDYHHRSPRVNFWAIPYERANNEGRRSPWGPMTETWSVWESILILRDHLVKGESDPFGIYDWYRSNSTTEAVSKAAAA